MARIEEANGGVSCLLSESRVPRIEKALLAALLVYSKARKYVNIRFWELPFSLSDFLINLPKQSFLPEKIAIKRPKSKNDGHKYCKG